MSAVFETKPAGRLKRWLQAGGGFFVFSLIVHGVLLIGAAVWVVKTVQAKRKLNFSAAPPASAEGSRQLEYRVQAAKRTASMSPPPSATRIVSSATNVKVALPEVALPSASSLAIPSRIGGMTGNPSAFKPVGAGAVAGPAPGAAMAAMPVGVTSFGVKVPANAPVMGLRGALYYMRRKPDGTIYPENFEKADYLERVERLLGSGGKLNEREASNYLRLGQQLVTQTILFSAVAGESAPRAFGVDQVPGTQQSWIAVYKARIFAEAAGKRYRFVGGGNEVLVVRVDDKLVLDGSYEGLPWKNGRNPTGHRASGKLNALWSDGRRTGDFFTVPAKGVDLEIIIGEGWGGAFGADLCVEEEGRLYKDDVRPVFKIEGYQKMLPQLQAVVSSPAGERALTLEGPTFRVTR
jgi:hypothetical protein